MPYGLLLQAIIIPIAASPVVYFFGRTFGSKAAAWLSFAVLLYSTLALIYSSTLGNPVSELYPWFPQQISNQTSTLGSIGKFGLYLDGVSMPFAITIYIICTAAALYSLPYMGHRIGEQEEDLDESIQQRDGGTQTLVEERRMIPKESSRVRSRFGLYYALYLLYSAGMVGTVLSTNLIELYFFFEFMLIPSYFLIAEFGYGARGRISFMYLLWTHIGALLMLLAFLAMGTLGGNFVFLGSGALTSAQLSAVSNFAAFLPWIVFGLIVGLFVKLAAFGLHIWLPYAHGEAPTPISALLSPAMIGIGGYIVIRMLALLLPSAYTSIGLGISLWGVVTMFYGGIMALAQDDIKRLFAYSSVSQMGYIIFGIGTTTQHGVEGAVFQFVSHGTSKAILFMVAGIIIVQAGGLRSIPKMGGLSTRLPITATCAMIGFLGLFGFPETNGFQSEWLIFSGGFLRASTPGPDMNWWMLLSVLAVISTMVTGGYALWTMKRVFFGKLPSELERVKEPSAYMLAPLIVLAALTILLGVVPGLIDNPLISTVSHYSPPLVPVP
jgi:NADH-quinone oxidoreductase subunit M